LFLMIYIYVVALSWIWGRTIVNPLFVIVEVFRWTPVPWFFPHRVFHVKILALICVIVALYLFIVWFCFYCTKREKGLGLVNCELYSAELIRLVVPSFPNISIIFQRNTTSRFMSHVWNRKKLKESFYCLRDIY